MRVQLFAFDPVRAFYVIVNSAIILIDTANERLRNGMNVMHATIDAARRRAVPTALTLFAVPLMYQSFMRLRDS